MQGIPLDAIAVADAATYDGETLYPHVVRLFAQYPQVRPWIEKVLYDSACDSQPLKEKFRDQLGIELKASLKSAQKKNRDGKPAKRNEKTYCLWQPGMQC